MTTPPAPEGLSHRLTRAWRSRTVARKAVSFALVGVVNVSVDFSVFSFAYFYLKWPIVIANVVAWGIAVSGSYVMNSLITFAAESGGQLRPKAYATFILAQTGGLAANTATVVTASYFVPVLVAKVFAIGASFLVNFTLSHFVVFRRQGKTTSL